MTFSDVTVLAGVAVGAMTWIVNEAFARRAVRRNIRIEYLLSAYRRLDNASNRAMTTEHERDLEQAVSDIQLLGSPRQARLAGDFASAFAAHQRADTEPLLEDLRASLRQELRLASVPSRRVWLRVHSGGQGPLVGTEFNAAWASHLELVRIELNTSDPVGPPDALTAGPMASAYAVAEKVPIAALVQAEGQLASALRRLLGGEAREPVGLNTVELAQRALDRGLVSEATSAAIAALQQMHLLAIVDDGGRRLTTAQAQDFVRLAEGVIRVLPDDPCLLAS